MKKELTWLEVYETGRDFRQGVIKDSLGLMTVAEMKVIEEELKNHKKLLTKE